MYTYSLSILAPEIFLVVVEAVVDGLLEVLGHFHAGLPIAGAIVSLVLRDPRRGALCDDQQFVYVLVGQLVIVVVLGPVGFDKILLSMRLSFDTMIRTNQRQSLDNSFR